MKRAVGCISSFSYIKPQLSGIVIDSRLVVFHPFPTSNRNLTLGRLNVRVVVFHPFPTSNRNVGCIYLFVNGLYFILFLHQTATIYLSYLPLQSCISSFSYIKPQRRTFKGYLFACCISSFSYIKPQLYILAVCGLLVVFHPFPTSNRNY